MDPAKQALATALAALLPEEKRSQLEALVSNTQGTAIDSKAEQLDGITFGELAERYQQARSGRRELDTPKKQHLSERPA